MGEEHLFPETLRAPANRCHDLSRNPREIAPAVAIQIRKHEWHESRSRGLNGQAKLLRQIVSERRRPHLWDRETPGRYDQRGGSKSRCLGSYHESVAPRHLANPDV